MRKEIPMIQTVIFDIGKVLISFDWKATLASMDLSEEDRNILAKAMFQNPDWLEFDRGVLTTEEVLARFALKAPGYESLIRQAYLAIYREMRTFPYTKDWILRLKKAGLNVYYLSNYGKEPRELSRETLSFTELMDGGLFSYEVKMIKPSPWIYLELCQRYGIRPEEAVFIDDNADNIQTARALGLHAILFTSYEAASRELEALIPALNNSDH